MTQSNWISSYQLQQLLKSFGCEIMPDNDGIHVVVYYPKSEKVVTITSNGSLPPFEIDMIMSTLGLKV